MNAQGAVCSATLVLRLEFVSRPERASLLLWHAQTKKLKYIYQQLTLKVSGINKTVSEGEEVVEQV